MRDSMGLFDKIFGNRPKEPKYESFFKLLDGYVPQFYSFQGGLYESELIRAAINARATHISKLQVEVKGAAKPALQNKMKHAPNEFQTWSQFMYRLSTILDINNTAFLVPIFDRYGEPSGVYAPVPDRCSLVEHQGTPYLRYKFSNGETAAMELRLCGIMSKYQYLHDFFGESNKALLPTLDLIKIQNQGIKEGVKSAAAYRFMAQMSNFSKAEDLAKERKRFTAENFSADADAGGMLLFPNTYQNIKQIEVKPWVVDAEQMNAIKNNVFEYFMINEDVLTNKAFGDAWSAFYEGAIEPFAIQFSEVVTKMFYTLRERTEGNRIMATANRLQYMSNTDKLNVSAQMLDRGIFNRDDIREIWNLPPLPNGEGQAYVIRGEYYNASDKLEGNDNGQ